MEYWVKLNAKKEIDFYFISNDPMVDKPGVWWCIDTEATHYKDCSEYITHYNIQKKLLSIIRDNKLNDLLRK